MRLKVLAFYTAAFAVFYTIIGQWPTGTWPLITQYGVFFLLGLLGALVANSTGAGGGVVFIPFFAALGLSSDQAVGTSMAIQCCGMTMGAVAWLIQIKKFPLAFHCPLPLIQKVMLVSGVTTAIGMALAQYTLPKPPLPIEEMFRWFSMVFGVVLFTYTFATRKTQPKDIAALAPKHWWAIGGTCIGGGMITAWLSVGVGECLALLLFFVGFSAKLAVAMGVFVSAVAVLTGVIYHIVVTQSVVWEVFLFAGQAALIGGFIARYLTLWLGGFKLKLFFAVWIFLSGIFVV